MKMLHVFHASHNHHGEVVVVEGVCLDCQVTGL